MRILLGISIVVLVAILWSAISIVRHIRLGRRRNALVRRRQNEEQAQAISSLRYTAVAPLPARFAASAIASPEIVAPVVAATLEAPMLLTETPAVLHATPDYLTELVAQPVVASLVEEMPESAMQPVEAKAIKTPEPDLVPVSLPELMPVSAMREQVTGIPVTVAESLTPAPMLRILEVPGDLALRDIYPSRPIFPSLTSREDGSRPAPPPAIAPAPPADPNSRRPVRSVHQQPDGSRPSHRPDWIYFNKDMGDLSDPAPSRVRVRTR